MNYLIPNKRSRTRLQEDSRAALLRAGLTNVAPGTTAYSLLSAIDGKIAALWNDLEEAIASGFPSQASGIYLDLWGQSIGMTRMGSGPVKIRDNQKFYVPRGVLGDYTGGKDITLGPGLEVLTEDGQPPVWRVIPYRDGGTDQPVWKASQREIFVRTEALTPGAAANTGAGKLTRHNLPYDFVMTTNVSPITAARTVEDDDSFRFRLLDAYLALQGSNPTALEHALLELPDVDSVIIEPFTQGPGSVTVIVVPTRGKGDINLVERAEAMLARVLCAGEASQIRLARTRQLMLQLRVRSKAGQAIVSSVQGAVLDYLGALGAGDSMVASALVAAIHQVKGVDEAQLLTLNLDGQALPGQSLTLAADEIFVVPTPVTKSILVDVL